MRNHPIGDFCQSWESQQLFLNFLEGEEATQTHESESEEGDLTSLESQVDGDFRGCRAGVSDGRATTDYISSLFTMKR